MLYISFLLPTLIFFKKVLHLPEITFTFLFSIISDNYYCHFKMCNTSRSSMEMAIVMKLSLNGMYKFQRNAVENKLLEDIKIQTQLQTLLSQLIHSLLSEHLPFFHKIYTTNYLSRTIIACASLTWGTNINSNMYKLATKSRCFRLLELHHVYRCLCAPGGAAGIGKL